MEYARNNDDDNESASVPLVLETVEPPPPRVGPPDRNHSAYLKALPSTKMCTKTDKLRTVVTHIGVLAFDHVITWSQDGCTTYWMIEKGSIKQLNCETPQTGPIEWLAVSPDGLLFCTISNDNRVQLHDAYTKVIFALITLPFIPGAVQWVHKKGAHVRRLAISDRNSSLVQLYNSYTGSSYKLVNSKKISVYPVKVMRYNPAFDAVISADTMGIIEYWDPGTLQLVKSGVKFKLKSDTDLFEIFKCKTVVSAIEVSKDGKQFAVTSSDRKIRIFWYSTGKLRWVYDESLENTYHMRRGSHPLYKGDALEFLRRITIEREMENTEDVPLPNAVFDDSSNFIIYSSILGIKIVNLQTGKVARILGKGEKERFLSIALFQESGAGSTLLCCAFREPHMFMFS